LFIDIGTNCEIVLGGRDWLLATAAPAGPAFEGASIRCGMRAADGAIEAVAITEDGDLKLTVIGDTNPKGLCGSGLVDAVAALAEAGIIDASGRFAQDLPHVPELERLPDMEAVTDPQAVADSVHRLAERLAMIGQERVFVLHWSSDRDPASSVYLSQRDIRELQFAKAAIATGWRILLEEAGLEIEDIKQVLLAGSFGSYLNAKSAIRIGLVPDVGPRRIIAAGNVAGEGAKMALLSIRDRAAALALLEEVNYVELSDRSDFNDRFIDQLSF
jgi:uncharacterized 2Fe-2S/4Fe-4S cluster protein (DUF4445 family)